MKWRSLRIVVPIVLVAIVFGIYFVPQAVAFLYETVLFLSPLWLPVLLAYLAWPAWLTFARSQFVASIPYTTIELKPGVETPRSARPMELIFYSLYHRIDITKKEYLLGHLRSWWSFEVYAHAGKIRFFAHMPTNHVAAVEGRIRSEYRDIEIEEVRDYSREIPFNASNMRVHAREYTLAKPDPYPIKTYEEYESTGTSRDVMHEMLEGLAKVGKDEHVLVSYIIRPHQRERTSYFEDPHDSLHKDAYRVIGDIVGSTGDVHALPPQKQAVVRAIEDALKKPSFDCGIRALYVASPEAYTEESARKLDNLLEDFNDSELNSFTAYDPIEREHFLKKESFLLSPHLKAEHLVRLYRRRAFFAPPYVGEAFVLNTEELATVFHMPHAGRGTVLAHRAHVELEPPENLPV